MRGSLTAVRLLTLLLFLLLIAVCAYWALQILAPRPAIAPSASIGDAAAAPNLEPATTLFGAAGSASMAATDSGNIQVNGIAPGYYATALTAETRADPVANQRVMDHVPAGRWGQACA